VTKLCCFNRGNSDVSVFKHRAEATECQQVHWLSSSQGMNPLNYHVWSVKLEKYHELQPKPTTTDELKSPCVPPSEKSCYKNTSTRWWRTSTSSRLPVPTWLCPPVVVTPGICSNSVHLQVCFIVTSPVQQTGSSQPPTDYR